ncbi:MAG: histidine--tRNA ligase [Fimbriimonadales bacterium]
MRFQAPRGTEDVLPGESERWQWLEAAFRRVCALYDFREIRTPTFEDTQLFHRVGEGSDVVSKEMYTFEDKGGRSITLKAEGTAPAVRAYIEHSVGAPGQVSRLFYLTPIFRYDRPQKGRLREHHQAGVEILGSSAPAADAEVIDLTTRFYAELGLGDLVVRLNSLGDSDSRGRYTAALLEFARPVLANLAAEYRERCEKNPLRLLDSKDEAVQAALEEAPTIDEFIDDESTKHFAEVLEALGALGIRFEVNTRLVRGLDYYNRTVFEVHSLELGAQSQLCGGGRYDGLVEECGGPSTPAVGMGLGIERALLVLESMGRLPEVAQGPKVFAVCLTENRAAFMQFVAGLRREGVSVHVDPDARSAKSQFRQADRVGAAFAVVIGDDELTGGEATVKDLAGGTERRVAFADVAAAVRG